MVVAGKNGPEVEEVSNPFFAPKGNRMAYRSRTEYTWTMVIDGKPADSAPEVGDPVGSEDGKHLAFRLGTRGKYQMVNHGKESAATYPQVSEPIWNTDNKTVAYIVTDATKGGEYIVYGDRQTEVYGRCYPPVFSADGAHMAYAAR